MIDSAFDPGEFGKRLKAEMGERWSVRALERELGERYSGTKGISYGTIRSYQMGHARDDGPHPKVLQALAEVLSTDRRRLRWRWLGYGEGAPTEDEESVRLAQEEAAREEGFGLLGFLRAAQEEFDPGSSRLTDDPVARMVLLEAWGRLLTSGHWPRAQVEVEPSPAKSLADLMALDGPVSGNPPSIRLPQTLPEEDGLHYAVAVVIGRYLAAPFRWLPISPQDLTDKELRDHVIRTCQVLHGLANTHRQKEEP